jgi:acetyltransferase-like isoleucine patch superfamily enzyme
LLLARDSAATSSFIIRNWSTCTGARSATARRSGSFVEIQKNASIGPPVQDLSHTFICEGVAIEDDVFVGHGVMFINDRYPRATAPEVSRRRPTGK